MKLHQLRDVIAIAERGSVRSASRELRVAQSAITRSIRSLESELGASLFERRKRGTALTPMGLLFVRKPRLIIAETRRARQETQQQTSPGPGNVVACLS